MGNTWKLHVEGGRWRIRVEPERIMHQDEKSIVALVKTSGSLFLVRLVALLEDLRVNVTRSRTATFGNVATDINELTALLAGRACFGWAHDINGIAAFVALKYCHPLLLSKTHVHTKLARCIVSLKPLHTVSNIR